MSATTQLGFYLLCGLFLGACGDDSDAPIDVRDRCSSGSIRLAVQGTVGPTEINTILTEPIAGDLSDDYFDVVLETGDDPHMIVFDTNGLTDDTNIRTALDFRMRSGAEGASTLEVTSRPEETPCDPRDGVICAYFGIDTNRDGDLFGVNEVIYPALAGSSTVNFSQVSGNVLEGVFTIQFEPLSSGEEADSDVGGALSGCFRYNIPPDGSRVF
jgi:hypothetical protein